MAKWQVEIKKKIVRQLPKLPGEIQEKALALAIDLRHHGKNPGKKWQNFSSLGDDKYHCHLTYRYIEVYYVGSREKAPY